MIKTIDIVKFKNDFKIMRITYEDCPACLGGGYKIIGMSPTDEQCGACNGSGKIKVERPEPKTDKPKDDEIPR